MAGPRLSAEARRAQIIEVATRLAAERDLRLVPSTELASAAGISDGLLFHYFPTKHDLAVQVYRHAADELLADLAAAASTDDPVVGLLAGLGATLDHVQAKSAQWLVLLRRGNDPDTSDMAGDLQEQLVGVVADALMEGEPAPPELVLGLRGWLQLEWAVCEQWLDDPNVERSTVEALLIGSFQGTLEGVAAVSPEVAAAHARLVAALGS